MTTKNIKTPKDAAKEPKGLDEQWVETMKQHVSGCPDENLKQLSEAVANSQDHSKEEKALIQKLIKKRS